MKTLAAESRPRAPRGRRPAPWSASPRTRAIRGRSSCSIPATAASTTAPSPRSGVMEKDIVLRFRDAAARRARTIRQVPRGDDAHRRHLHSAGRPRAHGAHPAGGAVRLDPRRRDRRRARARRRAPPSTRCRRPPPTPRPARLAENENRADVIAGIDLSHEPGDVADILIDLAQRETKAFSRAFRQDAGRRHAARSPGCTRIR